MYPTSQDIALRTSPYAKCCSIPCKVPHRRPPPSPRLPFPLPLGKATKIQIYSASATDTVYAAYYWYAPSTSDESPKPPLEIHSNESLILLRTTANPQIPHTHTSIVILTDVCVCMRSQTFSKEGGIQRHVFQVAVWEISLMRCVHTHPSKSGRPQVG